MAPSVGADSRVCPALPACHPACFFAIEGQVLGQTRESAPTLDDVNSVFVQADLQSDCKEAISE